MKELIKTLSNMHGISGYEYRINENIKGMVKDLCDDAWIDNLGNVIAVKKCGIKNAKKVLIEAHIDEIGLMVSDIDENGFISIVNVGGIDPRILPSAEVIIHGKRDIKGVIGAKPPHLLADGEEEKSSKMKDMAVDTGLSLDQLKEIVSIGDSITMAVECTELFGDQITGKSLDDRACSASVITVLKNIQKENLPFDVYAVFAAKEEVGGFGAMTATYNINPDIAIAIDVCHGITPDNSKDAYEIGDGCVITIGPNIHPKISDRLIKTAKENDIKHQIEVEGGNTGTDAWVMQVVGEGIPTGLLSLPLKYMHTTVETISVSDALAVSDLLTFFLKNLDDEMEEWLCL